jgi:hypothetical protein
VRRQIVDLALDEPELSPRELAVRFTDTERYFVSEASVYRLLKAQDLILSPAYITIKAAPFIDCCAINCRATDEFHDKTVRPNQLWQTDFTYLKDEPLKAPMVRAQWRTAGDGSISARSSMTTAGMSSPGGSARR